ncbi:MAG TPA: hypothetical protein VGI32_03760 [Steroidobacteraceae bacterium]
MRGLLAACVILALVGNSATALEDPAPSPATPDQFDTGRLQRVRALHVPQLRGVVPTYYSPGYKHRAADLQRFVTAELRFAQRQWGVQVPLSLAVLDRAQWSTAERQLPYPMPSVSGEPPVALMPADWSAAEDFFARESEVDPKIRAEITAHGLTWHEANHRAGDLIGGHELGHAVVDAYGIEAGTRWLNELLASYVLVAYLESERRDLQWLIDVVQAGNRIDLPQHHVSLEDFESQYMEILEKDGENYGSYQGQFLAQAKRVYANQGVDFLKQVRAAFPAHTGRLTRLGNVETLRRLEKISPGFTAWAVALEQRPRK